MGKFAFVSRVWEGTISMETKFHDPSFFWLQILSSFGKRVLGAVVSG